MRCRHHELCNLKQQKKKVYVHSDLNLRWETSLQLFSSCASLFLNQTPTITAQWWIAQLAASSKKPRR